MKCHITDDLSLSRTLKGSAVEWHAQSLLAGRPAPRLSQWPVGHEYYAERCADGT
jgi:hypothetical protein